MQQCVLSSLAYNFNDSLSHNSACVYLNLLGPGLRILVLYHTSPKPES